MTRVKAIVVSVDDEDQRLDRWLKRMFPTLNHIKIEKMCRKGELRIDGSRVKPSTRLERGQEVRIPPFNIDQSIVSKTKADISHSDKNMISSSVIYKDDYIFVLNKPPGIAVQGGSNQNKTNIDILLDVLREDGFEKPRLVHRLDKDTSGVMLLARTRKVAELLSKSFKFKSIRKIYWALVAGNPPNLVGTIRYGLLKQKIGFGNEKVICIHPDEFGNNKNVKKAVTDYVVIEKITHRATWVGLSPITGRTHQLRAHMAEIGCPIIGDGKYGTRAQTNEGAGWGAQIGGIISRKLHLHARSILFSHPVTQTSIFVEADLPVHMKKSWETFNWNLKWAPKNPFKIHE